MSTEHQKYSTENQADVIRQYAARRGLTIVTTYADQGKSGLNFGGRAALQKLVADIERGQTAFSVVLVYDVSRWGRFQDADESAYYEYRCRKAGVRVEYCAEEFENDGSLGSDIQKMLKRKMAGEYSRELSVKVFAGQCRLIELGYRQGGAAGFGLRRQLIDEKGVFKNQLARKEQKSIHTDRVILVPGPDPEVETVRSIYHAFVEEGRPEREISVNLNARGIVTDLGRPWTRGTVHQILINEKYVGANVWNRGSFKLKHKRIRNDPEMWVRSNHAFAPVVEQLLFDAAQAIIRTRSYRASDEEMLDALRRILGERGMLSGLVIDETENCPSSSAYQNRFGSLLQSFALIGYTPARDYRYIEVNRRLRAVHPIIMRDTLDQIRKVGSRVKVDPQTDLVNINDEFTASIVLSRCQETRAGSRRWVIRFDAGLCCDITIAVRMSPGNNEAQDYYLLPAIDMMAPKLRLSEQNEATLDAYNFSSLDALYNLVRRIPLKEVA